MTVMARMKFDPKHKAEQIGNFPKLKLEHKGDRARVLCVEEPEYAWTHTLKMPAVLDGRAVTQQVTTFKGELVDRMKMDFVGRPICLGDPGILEDKHVDVKNCPACARSVESDTVSAPERRFAMHVITYAIKPGGFDLRTPFSSECVVWAYGDSIYNKLTDFVTQWGSLTEHDLFLGPCENVDFQKYEIAISSAAAWKSNTEWQSLVLQTFQENQTEHLEAFCGRKVNQSFMEEDLQKIANRWRIINGEPLYKSDGLDGMEQKNLTESLGALLDRTSSDSVAPEVPASDAGPQGFGDLLASMKNSASPTGDADGSIPTTPPPTPPSPSPVPDDVPPPTPTPHTPPPAPQPPHEVVDVLGTEPKVESSEPVVADTAAMPFEELLKYSNK